MDQWQQDMSETVDFVGVILPRPALAVEEAKGIIWKGFLGTIEASFPAPLRTPGVEKTA